MSDSFLNGRVTLHPGDSREVLARLPDSSVDSVVTDPPYALVSIVKRFGSANAAPASGNDAYKRASAGFMGQSWDTGETAFAATFWAEVLRVLKPGGYVVAASGTRTYHRLAVAIEDAGFEIRDMVSWLYGSGFPKSHDVSKGIDKAAGVKFEAKPASGVGFMGPEGPGGYNVTKNQLTRAGEQTDAAREWEGWGTALKPACEPWVLARKPLIGTVAANVLAHGTGALNIGACRVAGEKPDTTRGAGGQNGRYGPLGAQGRILDDGLGRWPANVLHDGSPEVVAAFPEATSGAMKREVGGYEGGGVTGFLRGNSGPSNQHGDSGSAARFYYSAKADADDRLGSKHPTVKPVDLMQYLVRLVTPKGGLVLDPFAGTGTTGEAAWREGMRAVLVEREPTYCDDIRRRMTLAASGPDERKRESLKANGKAQAHNDLPLFGGE